MAGQRPEPSFFDLGMNATYFLVFIDNNEHKLRFPAVTDAIIGNHAKGDLLFKVPGDDGEKVLKFTNKEFWIVSRFQDGNETSIYQGVFNKVTERARVKVNEKAAIDAAAIDLQQKIREIEINLPVAVAVKGGLNLPTFSGATTTSPGRPVAPAILATATDQPVTPRGITIPSGLSANTNAQIQVQIPGLAIDVPTPRSSIVASIRPRSIVPVQTSVTQATLAGKGKG